jgi:hypothetical protein
MPAERIQSSHRNDLHLAQEYDYAAQRYLWRYVDIHSTFLGVPQQNDDLNRERSNSNIHANDDSKDSKEVNGTSENIIVYNHHGNIKTTFIYNIILLLAYIAHNFIL